MYEMQEVQVFRPVNPPHPIGSNEGTSLFMLLFMAMVWVVLTRKDKDDL